jgi:hypothetical protein
VLLQTAKTSSVISPGTSDKVNDLRDLDPPGPAVRQKNVGADKKGREPITRLLKIEDGVYRSRYNLELDRDFDSPNVVGVVKSNRLRYAEHMIRGAEYLPQRALFRAMPEGRRNQGRPKSSWMA